MVQAVEEAKNKIKDDLTPIAKDCMNLHALMEGNDSAQYRHLLLMKAINTIF
jgi:hypothetical protein